MSLRVLVVDDNEINLTLISKILELEGYEVEIADNGPEAIRLVTRRAPDLAILDVMMPDFDGYELCRRLRQPPVNARMPIVMLTAAGDEHDRLHALEVGANDFITKPFEMEVLRTHIKSLLDPQLN